MNSLSLRRHSFVAVLAFLALAAILAEGEDKNTPTEPIVLGKLSFSVGTDLRPAGQPPYLVFMKPSEKSIAAIAVSEISTHLLVFSLPDGKEIARLLLPTKGLLPGRNEVGLYMDNLLNPDDGRLFVLRDVANLTSLEPTGDPLKLPGGLTAGPPGYTIYTGSKWWVLYGEKDIRIIDRASLEIFTMPALYGAESRVAISDDVAVLMKLARDPNGQYLNSAISPADQSYFALLSKIARTWQKLPYVPEAKEENLSLWIPFEGYFLGTSTSSEKMTSATNVYQLTDNGECKWLYTSPAMGVVKPYGKRTALVLRSLVFHNYTGPDFRYCMSADYLDLADRFKMVASGREEFKHRDFQSWTVAAGLGKSVDAFDDLFGPQLSLKEGGVTKPIKSEDLTKCNQFYAIDNRLYAWAWTTKEETSECMLMIVKLDEGFLPGVRQNLMDFVR